MAGVLWCRNRSTAGRRATPNGGTTIEDPPGVRQGAAGQLYLAYLRDPDGNKLCALYHMQP
jgi:hypothetical protein